MDGVAAATLTGGSLVAVALIYAVGLLALAEAGRSPDTARCLVRGCWLPEHLLRCAFEWSTTEPLPRGRRSAS